MTHDLRKSIRRLGRYYYVTVPLPGTLAAEDYLGDTDADEGLPLPRANLHGVHVNLQTAPGTSSTITVENESTGDSVDVDVEDTWHQEEVELSFATDDEVSVAVTAADGGEDGHVTLEYRVPRHPMN